MRNLHLIILQEFGIEARRLLREWERLRLRSSDYKNHRIFSLRCIHQELIPVSIKLKSTLDTPKARQIIRKAEKDLLQARIKAINNILVQVEKEIQDCRTKLASIISQKRLEQCQGFINKVSELRFNKVKQRQINKLNYLVSKKEGNITITSNNTTLNRQVQSPPRACSRNPTPATALLPPGEGDNSPPAAVHLPLEGNSLPNNQASNNNVAISSTSNNNNTTSNNTTSNSVSNQTNSQASQVPPLNPTPAIAHLPPREGSNYLLGDAHLPSEAGTSPPQPNPTTAREENNSSQANPPPATNNSSRASQAGHSNNPPRASRQGTRHSPRHQPSQPSPEACTTSREGTPSSTPPNSTSQGSSKEEPNPKWVINLSNKPLTPAQRSVLAKGPNFAVTPRQPPNLEYITAIEAACTKLSQQDAEELRADINRVLRSSHPPKPNLTKAQNIALRELKRDRDRIVLTADKGVAMVVMDKQDYINKSNQLLNQNTYKVISKDPTNTIKNKLINILKGIKTKTGLGSNTYKSMYPTGCVPPKFYGLPKIHKPDTPLRPIVSSCGSVTYGVAKELAKILKPLVGKSPHHINSTQDFVEQAKHFKLEAGECLSSYDVSALFTSVPIDPALNIIKDLLVKDNTLKERTVMEVEDIILLLEFCLKNTYFSFQGQFYEQVEGAAMGSPVSPIVANLYMEYLEQKALSTAPNPPKFWGRYVDDTFVIHKEANKQSFLQHINSVDPAIRFTVEDNKEDGSIPFLDTIVKPEADGSLSITVYRKPTHTDQYLQWDSHHHLSAKFSVIQTLSHRASIVCSNPELLQKEKQHLRKALTKCNYPKWALDKVEKRLNRSTRQVNDGGNNSAQPANHEVQSKGHIVIPYTQGLCESIKKICGRYGIQTHFKGGKTIKNLLVSPKDKDPILNQSGAIYRYQCNNLGCDDEYIGETSRTFGERYKEHLKAPSAIHHHSTITGHSTNHNNFQIIGREGHNLARNIKESIYIRVNNPSLNNNIGKFNLSHIWDRVLLNTKGLTLK